MNIIKQYLTLNPYSRSGEIIERVQGLAIHYFNKPLQTAHSCWQYFEDRKQGLTDYGSAQYIIGLKGEVLQTMPAQEVAFHVGSSKVDPISNKIYTDVARAKFGIYTKNVKGFTPNYCMVGIECAHLNATGEMTKDTYASLVTLTKYLMNLYSLNTNDIFTHKEIVGWKDCHKWFVNNPQAWAMFKHELQGV